ncbi:ankyrin repeat-containing domain protein [Russula dissimulans]|nr:ankyrin repeat-containing domain protein [Russula dissimulans]
MKREAQRGFEDSLRSAIQKDSLENYDFRNLIERGAHPNTQLNGLYPLRRDEACPHQFITGAKFVTLLQFAANKGNKELVEYLLKTGAEPDIKGGRYETALQAASAIGNIDVVSLLVENGADVTIQGGEYGTAIRAASRKGHLMTAFLLCENGGNPSAYLPQNLQPAHLTCVKIFGRISDQLFSTSEIL